MLAPDGTGSRTTDSTSEMKIDHGAAGDVGASRVLLVEDDEGDALIVQENLALAAPEIAVDRAGSLAAALEMLPDDVSCALLDLGLPDTVGLDAVRKLRERAPRLAVVVLTGRNDEQLGIEALGAGAQDYLVKGQVEPEVLARAIRYAIERRRSELSDQELLEARLRARENARLERGLLPRALIEDPRLTLTSDYRPGRERALLGGDFFDAVELADGSVHLMIGDVCGHGADEAALGACLRAAWRALALALHPPEEVMATLHEMLPHERHAEHVFATLCAVAIPPDRRTATVRLAGHPAPILIDGGGVCVLDVPAGAPPLGIFDQDSWPGKQAALGDSWSLLLYTDGLVEGRIGNGNERLGEDRLVEMVRRHLATTPDWRENRKGLLNALISEVEQLNGQPVTDDIAVLLLSANGG
jgi:serine phosphatase RsbU (regulator of sigma subunit)